MKQLLLFILAVPMLYFIFAFIVADINSMNWIPEARFFLSVLWLGSGGYAIIWYMEEKEQPK